MNTCNKYNLRNHADEVTASRIRLHRQQDKTNSIVLVEGESDLLCFDARLLNGDFCKVWQMNGRERVVEALTQVRNWDIPGVIAIVDADFDRISGSIIEANDLFYCDGHDAEIMIGLTSALDELIRFKADEKKIETAKEKYNQSIREIVLNMGAPIGAAMLVDREKDWKLSFKELPYEKFIDRKDFVCDENELAKILVQQRLSACIDQRDYAKKIRQKVREINSAIELCRGHDFCKIFALCFAKGNPNNFLDKAKDIEDGMRMVFQRAQFETTELFSKLIRWQTQNSASYRII